MEGDGCYRSETVDARPNLRPGEPEQCARLAIENGDSTRLHPVAADGDPLAIG